MKAFIDNNLSTQLSDGLKGFGEDVVHLKDMFDEDASDEDWLRKIGLQGLTLVTRDNRIRRRPAELEALKSHNVGAFFLGGKKLNRCQIIQQLVRNWPRIKELSGKTRRPFAYRIPPKGANIERIQL